MILGDSVTGESAEVAKVYAALARQIQQYHHPIKPPVALISGGETTVTLRQPAERNQLPGRGGRCTEFLLSLAIDLAGLAGVHALACDTDGIDGSEENAGALLFPDALARAAAKGIDGLKCQARNDAFTFFHALDDLVVTGPTRTNVNDYRIILVQ
jgi:glycerate 2-kinase